MWCYIPCLLEQIAIKGNVCSLIIYLDHHTNVKFLKLNWCTLPVTSTHYDATLCTRLIQCSSKHQCSCNILVPKQSSPKQCQFDVCLGVSNIHRELHLRQQALRDKPNPHTHSLYIHTYIYGLSHNLMSNPHSWVQKSINALL